VHAKCLSLRRAVVICTSILCKGPCFTPEAPRFRVVTPVIAVVGGNSLNAQERMSHPQPDDLLPLALRLAFTPSRMQSTPVVVRLRLNADPLVLSPANVRHCLAQCAHLSYHGVLDAVPFAQGIPMHQISMVCSFVVPWRSRRGAVCSRNTYRYGLLKEELQMSRLDHR